MRVLQALIVDDERYAREELLYLLDSYSDIHVLSEVSSGEDAVMTAIEQSPDVMFLDIEMPKRNGIEVAQSLQQLKIRPQIIFTTAYSEFAVDAFRVNALDYLLKPYKREELDEAINKLRAQLIESNRPNVANQSMKLPVESDGEILFIDVNEIAYIYPNGKSSKIVTKEEQFDYNSSLKKAEERLKVFGFFRTHRSFLVNLSFVKRMSPWFNGAYELELTGIEEKISVSRNYARAFMERLHI